MNTTLKFIMGAIGNISLVITFITSATESMSQLKAIFWPHPYLVTTLAFLVSLAWFFPIRKMEPVTLPDGRKAEKAIYPGKSWKLPLAFVQTAFFIYALVTITIKLDEEPILPLNQTSLSMPIRYVSERQSPVSTRLNLFVNFSTHTGATDGEVFYVRPDPAFAERRRDLSNGSSSKEQRHAEIIKFLKKRASEVDKPEYLFWLESNANLISLTETNFTKLAFLRFPFNDYMKAGQEERDTYSYWMRTYMGQWCPKIRITVDNDGTDNLTIVSVLFDVKKFKGENEAMGSVEDVPFGAPLPAKEGVVEIRLADYSQGEKTIKPGESDDIEIVFNPKLGTFATGTWTGYLSVKDKKGVSHHVKTMTITTHNPNLRF